MKASKLMFNIMSVICFIYGTLYIFSLVFIPIGVYCYIAAKRFSFKAENLMDNYTVSNKTLKNYVIFVCIACFPLGFLSIIPYLICASNNISVETTKESETSDVLVENIEKESDEKIEKEPEAVEPHTEQTEAEKLEKFEKLKNFHEKGIITDDELEMARQQLFGKDEN